MSLDTPDRRRAERRAVNAAGTIRFKNGREKTCTVVNLSDSGARLSVVGGGLLPERFALACGIRRARRVRVVWRNGQDLGVAFEAMADG